MARTRHQVKLKPHRARQTKTKPPEQARPSERAQQQPAAPSAVPPPTAPPRRTTYFEAVALYEKGLAAIQQHEYMKAIQQLESVLRLYPEEKELHERVRLYLNICRRQAERREASPRSVDERLYAATLALNSGRHEEAISHLRLVRDEDPDNDHALYMLAVALTSRGEHAEAVAHLERAIAINPENRALARREPDFEPLWEDEAFLAALEHTTPADRSTDHRRPFRGKTGR